MHRIILLLILCFGLCYSDCSIFGEIPSQFNTWVRGNFSCTHSSTQGRLAAGGNVDIGRYDIGCKLREPHEGKSCARTACEELREDGELEYSLVAGLDLKARNVKLYGGGIAYGNDFHREKKVEVRRDCGKEKSNPIDFEHWHQFLISLSKDLMDLETTGLTEVSKDGSIVLRGQGHKELEVFYLCGCALEEANSLRITGVDKGASVIVQVSGLDFHIEEFELHGFKCENVLFNFYEATKLIFCDVHWRGSVLAPLADIEDSVGSIDGQIFGKSWSSSESTCMEQNDCKFEGVIPERSRESSKSPSHETKGSGDKGGGDGTKGGSGDNGGDNGTGDNEGHNGSGTYNGGDAGTQGSDNGGNKGGDGGTQVSGNNGGYNQDPATSPSAIPAVSNPTPVIALPFADGSVAHAASHGSGLSAGGIAGIVIGSVAFVALMAGLTAFILLKKGAVVRKAGAVALDMPDVPAS